MATPSMTMSCAASQGSLYIRAALGNKITKRTNQKRKEQIIKMASNQVMSPARRKWTQFVGTVGARTCNTTQRIALIFMFHSF
jgi:hypothetical protein